MRVDLPAPVGPTRAMVSPGSASRVMCLTVGVAADVLEKGCAGLGQRPGNVCSADYDLVHTDGNTLTFGMRPTDNDMCTADKRPVALSKLSMKRVP